MVLNNKAIRLSTIKVNDIFDFGNTSLSKKEIIAYAKEWDPLPFHVSEEAGNKSMFRGLIASGPQIFHEIHRRHWLPLFGKSVICGLGVHNWLFLAPIYPNKTINSRVTVREIDNNQTRNCCTIKWFYEFLQPDGAPYQTLEMSILHSLA